VTHVAHAIAEWLAELDLDAVPEQTVVATQKALLNSIGTGLAAFELDDVQRALRISTGAGETGPSTVWVDGSRLPTMSALFVNGVMLCTLGQEETHSQSGTHPAETTIPAVLAVAQLRRITGRRMLEAILAGIETTVAVASMELTPPVKYDNCEAPAVYGTVGAAAAAGYAMGLDTETLGHAIALGANLAGGLSECVRVGTSEYHFSVGNASVNGYLGARLGEAGKVAARTSLEGPAGFYQLFGAAPRDALAAHDVVGDVLGSLRRRWAVTECIYKPYPVHFFNQVHIDGARAIRDEHGLMADEVTAIRLTINPLAYASGGPNTGPFDSRESVLGSTSFCVAAMLVRGHVNLHDTLDYADPTIGRLVGLTAVTGSDDMDAARVEVDARGQTFVYDAVVSGRDLRLGIAEIATLFHEVLDGVLPESRRHRIESLVREIRDLADGGELPDLLVRDSD
jgi:2-methylcitrate dehydratase PrpD